MRPIESYMNLNVEGWAPFPFLEGEQVNFINAYEGIHLVASVKDLGKLKVIHLSLSPISTIPTPPTVEELFYRTAGIIRDFFGDRGFAMRPDDPRNPDQKHYFSILEEGEE